MIFQEIAPEVLYHLVDYISLFFNGRVVEFRSLKVGTHERYWLLIILIVLLCKHNDERSIRSESVE